jgi:hypothetical protein
MDVDTLLIFVGILFAFAFGVLLFISFIEKKTHKGIF